jgi:hypothetical protein
MALRFLFSLFGPRYEIFENYLSDSTNVELGLGVGEFRDLLEFVDFNLDIGSSIIQLLPINDTRCSNSWKDSYPYRYIPELLIYFSLTLKCLVCVSIASFVFAYSFDDSE